MIRIARTNVDEPGAAWKFVITGMEADEIKCSHCKKQLKSGEQVYLCQVCKKIYCMSHKWDDSKSSFLCTHYVSEFQHYCGFISIEEPKILEDQK